MFSVLPGLRCQAFAALAVSVFAVQPVLAHASDTKLSDADLPPDAKVGECYARVYVPATFTTETQRVLQRATGEELEIVPAEYGTETEKILIKPERVSLVEVPAQYETETEQIEVKSASTEWKKGPCDPKRQLQNATGECLCLVEVPAQYRTVSRRVMVSPPTTREIVVPAEYTTITKTVEIRPAQVRRTPIPEEYGTVTRTVKVSEAGMKWQIIDCTYGVPVMDSEAARALQTALKAKGFDPGPIDGVFGSKTRSALQSFQEANDINEQGFGAATRAALGM